MSQLRHISGSREKKRTYTGDLCRQPHLTVGLREEPTLLPLVDALPPALADIGPGDGEQLAGPQLDLAGVRLRLEVVQRRRLSVCIAEVSRQGGTGSVM